jgi:hypothetical protein
VISTSRRIRITSVALIMFTGLTITISGIMHPVIQTSTTCWPATSGRASTTGHGAIAGRPRWRRDAAGLKLTPISDEPALKLVAGRPEAAEAVLARLVPVAQATPDRP